MSENLGLADELDNGRLAYEQGALEYKATTNLLRRAAHALRAQEKETDRLRAALEAVSAMSWRGDYEAIRRTCQAALQEAKGE